MYIIEVGVEYRIEMTLYDSFRLLTPIGIQDSHFGKYYTEIFITSIKQTKTNVVFIQGVNISLYQIHGI